MLLSRAGVRSAAAGALSSRSAAACPASRARTVRVRASEDNGTAFEEGATVRVAKEVKVFHAPKHADGLDLQGKTGTVVKNVAHYKDKVLSPNLPYKVQFTLPGSEGKPTKFFVHLEADELEPVA